MKDLAEEVDRTAPICTLLRGFVRDNGGYFASNNGGFTLYFDSEAIEEIKARLEELLNHMYDGAFIILDGIGTQSQNKPHISASRGIPCQCSDYSKPCFTVSPRKLVIPS